MVECSFTKWLLVRVPLQSQDCLSLIIWLLYNTFTSYFSWNMTDFLGSQCYIQESSSQKLSIKSSVKIWKKKKKKIYFVMLNKKTFIAGIFFTLMFYILRKHFFCIIMNIKKKKINDNIFFRPWNIFPWARKCLHIQVVNYNPLQNISAKIENSSKIKQDRKILISVYRNFWAPVQKDCFCWGDWTLGCDLKQLSDFTSISLLPRC